MEELPIYTLADYDGSGALLDLCRSLLAPCQQAKKTSDQWTNPYNTSGYQTNESTTKNNNDKGCLKTGEPRRKKRGDKRTPVIGLSWCQLIESYQAKQDPTAECYRSGILRLCSSLQEAVR